MSLFFRIAFHSDLFPVQLMSLWLRKLQRNYRICDGDHTTIQAVIRKARKIGASRGCSSVCPVTVTLSEYLHRYQLSAQDVPGRAALAIASQLYSPAMVRFTLLINVEIGLRRSGTVRSSSEH